MHGLMDDCVYAFDYSIIPTYLSIRQELESVFQAASSVEVISAEPRAYDYDARSPVEIPSSPQQSEPEPIDDDNDDDNNDDDDDKGKDDDNTRPATASSNSERDQQRPTTTGSINLDSTRVSTAADDNGEM
jgi:hypothetical protein